MDVQEVIDLLIKLKGKEEIKETNQALEETVKDLEKVEKQADKTGEAMSEATKVGKEFGSKLADALKQIATDSLDEETGLPSTEKAVKAVGTALDGLIDMAPAAATALGGPLAGMIAGQLTETVKGLKDMMIEYAEALVHTETEEEAAIRRQKEYAELIGKTVEEVKALEKAEQDRIARQEADKAKLEGVRSKEEEQKSKNNAAQINEAVQAVGGKQAEKDVAAALFKENKNVGFLAEEDKGNLEPTEYSKALRQQLRDKADREAAQVIQFARGAEGTPEEQDRAQKSLRALKNRGNGPEFAASPFGIAMAEPSKQDIQEEERQARDKEKLQKQTEKEAADKEKEAVRLKAQADKQKEAESREAERQAREQKAEKDKQDREKDKQDRENERQQKEADREQERRQRETEQAARQTLRDRPDLAIGIQSGLFEGGNSARAQGNVARQLEAGGIEPSVAGAMVNQQSTDLQNRFASALGVTGDVNSANIAIQRQLQQQYEKLVQQTLDLNRQQTELMQRMGTFGPTLQNQGR